MARLDKPNPTAKNNERAELIMGTFEHDTRMVPPDQKEKPSHSFGMNGDMRRLEILGVDRAGE